MAQMPIVVIDQIGAGEATPAESEKLYFAVPVATLVGLVDLHCDIFIRQGVPLRTRLYRSADNELALRDDESLRKAQCPPSLPAGRRQAEIRTCDS